MTVSVAAAGRHRPDGEPVRQWRHPQPRPDVRHQPGGPVRVRGDRGLRRAGVHVDHEEDHRDVVLPPAAWRSHQRGAARAARDMRSLAPPTLQGSESS